MTSEDRRRRLLAGAAKPHNHPWRLRWIWSAQDTARAFDGETEVGGVFLAQVDGVWTWVWSLICADGSVTARGFADAPGADPAREALEAAYAQCGSPNRSHA